MSCCGCTVKLGGPCENELCRQEKLREYQRGLDDGARMAELGERNRLRRDRRYGGINFCVD